MAAARVIYFRSSCTCRSVYSFVHNMISYRITLSPEQCGSPPRSSTFSLKRRHDDDQLLKNLKISNKFRHCNPSTSTSTTNEACVHHYFGAVVKAVNGFIVLLQK